jgi:hypothetical protein
MLFDDLKNNRVIVSEEPLGDLQTIMTLNHFVSTQTLRREWRNETNVLSGNVKNGGLNLSVALRLRTKWHGGLPARRWPSGSLGWVMDSGGFSAWCGLGYIALDGAGGQSDSFGYYFERKPRWTTNFDFSDDEWTCRCRRERVEEGSQTLRW